jgi:hypothetical protein
MQKVPADGRETVKLFTSGDVIQKDRSTPAFDSRKFHSGATGKITSPICIKGPTNPGRESELWTFTLS